MPFLPRRSRQARNFTTNFPKILDLKSSSEQIFSENWRWVPLNFSGPESCLMFAVFAFKIKVSKTLKMIQWNYQLTKQDWPVDGLGTVLLFNRFWFQHLPLDPKSHMPFRETGPWNVLLIGWSKFSTSKNYPDLDSASDWMKQILNQQKRYLDLSSDASSVWSFCARFSDVFSRGNQWWRREMSAVFSG